MISFDNDYLDNEPIGRYEEELSKMSSGVLFLSAQHKANYFNKVLEEATQANVHLRQDYNRIELRSIKRKGMGRKGRVSVGIQCHIQDGNLETDKVFII